MKKLVFALAFILLVTGVANAQSAKTAIQLSDQVLIPTTGPTGVWTNLLSATIKTSEQKDLILGVSLETGLFTRTLVKTKSPIGVDTQWAEANIEVQVLVDGVKVAQPGIVVFDKRYQELMATLGSAISCTDTDLDGHFDYTECTFTDQQVQLILRTMAAHHFNFALTDLGAGEHAVQLQARVTTNTSSSQATATGTVGKGALTVEEVRLVKDANILKPVIVM